MKECQYGTSKKFSIANAIYTTVMCNYLLGTHSVQINQVGKIKIWTCYLYYFIDKNKGKKYKYLIIHVHVAVLMYIHVAVLMYKEE